jgi:hypothetical protein
MSGLRLKAEDAPGLEVLSAALQDSVLKAGDLKFEPKARRFTAVVNRFVWESARQSGPYERVRAALAFDCVGAVKSTRLNRADKDAIASILSLAFDPAQEPPGGVARIVLAGGGEIWLDVECIDAVLLDIGAPWLTPRKPSHEAE